MATNASVRAIRVLLVALLMVGLSAGAASAAVTFDLETGTGFVGKGDVQSLMGWNNRELQNNAAGIGFRYIEAVQYDVFCEVEVQQGRTTELIQVDQNVVSNVRAQVSYDARTKNQISGFILLGADFNGGGNQDTPPAVGQACSARGTDGTIVRVEVVRGGPGELFLVYEDIRYPIWG